MQQNKSKAKRFAISVLLAVFMLFSAGAAETTSVIPIGHTVGIKLSAEGVLVVRLNKIQTEDGSACPAEDAGVREGDLIVKINGEETDSNDELQEQIASSEGGEVTLEVERDGGTKTLSVSPVKDDKGEYRIGVLVRDSMAGIGTLTYVDPETGEYGSLGHGICDSETGVLMPLKDGSLLYSVVGSVQKGKEGEPGALQGEFDPSHELGIVTENTGSGIFGTMTESSMYSSLESVPIAESDEIKTGEAEIITNVEGDKVERFGVEIVKLYPEDDEYGRGMMLKVTDKRLLEKTGGIVQGMSGSPVLQDGKLVGAVTHVLVNDPSCGYAICVQKMLEEMEN